MAHPFIVFRRSCQISPGSTYHLTPFTVPTVGFQLSRNKSFGANDSPSLFEFLTEGCSRLFGRTYQHTWMVPMWTLLVPTATFRLCHYGVQQMQDDSSVDYT
ncbi:hypothetical protein MAR_023575 [Mya arenaria]|uniref:Uncharacterized protein n=1 Tax=Mya arenaria TaxID=6604 RepID=A0ABY7DND2_MYAAR|nr:hypothetical protein MAR_023575 [Mya arenaria]